MDYVLCNAICYSSIFAHTSCSAYILIGLLGVFPDFSGLPDAITADSCGVGTLVASQLTGRVWLNRLIGGGDLMMTIPGAALILMPLIGYFTV